jgi:hypothetical protein
VEAATIVMAAAAVAGLAVGLAGIVAALKAWREAARAADAADEANALPMRTLDHAELQALLGTATYLVADRPELGFGASRRYVNIRVVNAGPSVAFGPRVRMTGLTERSAIDGPQAESAPLAALAQGDSATIDVPMPDEFVHPDGGERFRHAWLRIEVACDSPLGVEVRQTYEFATAFMAEVWQLSRVVIDPHDGRTPIDRQWSPGTGSDPWVGGLS